MAKKFQIFQECCRTGVANKSIAIDRSIAECQLVDRA